MMELRSNDDLDKNYMEYCSDSNIEIIRECPSCHYKILPNFIGEIKDEDKFIYLLVQCTNCGELITIKYSMKWCGAIHNSGYKYNLKEINPKKAKESTFPKKLGEISPMFIEIYKQASSAEANDLNQISGIGYRKSLEFLVKDYLKYKSPEKSSEIESTFLGQCIDMIDNTNIKKMSRGATWIGNDETHYVKRWENKDITDLKKLLDLTMKWIDLELTTEEYSEDMKL